MKKVLKMYQSIDITSSNSKSFTKVSRFRRILPQVLATTVKNSVLIDGGLIAALPTVIIPALTGISNEHNHDESLSITAVQASYIGSMAYIGKVLGSFASMLICDFLGRKWPMTLVNIPFAIGWFILYRTSTIFNVLFAFVLFGFAIGFMQAPIACYVAEICEPSCRSFLVAYSNICGAIGVIFVYILNAFLPWRSIALVGLMIPITSAFALSFVPETPQWLLSKNRTEQAENSLRWLRGWVPGHLVAQEFNELQRHSERSKSCGLCIKEELQCSHALPTLAEKFAELKRKSTLKPFFIIVSLFVMTHFTGSNAMRPYIMQIFNAYNSPIQSDATVIILGIVDNCGSLVFILLIRQLGKRRLYMLTGAGIFLSSFVVSTYGFIYLPNGYKSFDLQNQSFHLENKNLAYIPVISIGVWNFCSMCGFLAMPWLLLSEIFPFRSRIVASACASIFNYFLGFISKKTYYDLETTLSLPGITLLYCIITGVGMVWLYFILPDTENRSLEEIEAHFTDDSKKITDRKIYDKTENSQTQPLLARDHKFSYEAI